MSGGFGVRGNAAASTTGLAASLPPGFGYGAGTHVTCQP